MKCFLLFLIFVLSFSACSSPTELSLGGKNKEKLLEYLRSVKGNYIISGQMDNSWDDDIDPVQRVFNDTGKYPAIKGFDFMHIRHPSWGGGGSKQTEAAIEWWNNGPIEGINGIVTFCWHWKIPATGTERDYPDWDDFRPGFVIPFKDGQLDKTDPRWELIKEDLELVADELTKLRDAGVPVLWRPLHEASNFAGRPGWFWWGLSRTLYIALWNYMYEYFTYERNLDNLIWVWNGQNAFWVPDPSTFDIAGYDAYDENRDRHGTEPDYNNTFHELFTHVSSWASGKLIALTENGAIPDPDALIANGTHWLYFMTWDDHSYDEGITDRNNHWTGEWHNTNAHKLKVYHHPYVITLDRLPVLSVK
jgi:mannan endo-1,4-beta-mannosidase